MLINRPDKAEVKSNVQDMGDVSLLTLGRGIGLELTVDNHVKPGGIAG